jgi:Domain of unknown function (DUF4136)
MRIRQLAASAALGLAALGLSACATGLNTQVSRYQAAAIPAGQSFYVVPVSGAPDPGFYRYAAMVSQQLEGQGYKPAGAPQVADLLVKLDYSVDEGKTEYVREPNYGPGFGYGPYGSFGYDPFWGGGYWGSPFYSRWGGYPFYYGWNDPYWWGRPSLGYAGAGPYGYSPYGYGQIREYTVYKSFLDMNIVRRADNAQLFEGHAQARSQSDDLGKLVPPLVTAMFTGFPGKNGETVKITVPAK